MRWTPLQITMLCHYHAIAEPYAMRQPEHACSKAVFEQRTRLVNLGYLIEAPSQDSGYALTDKGRAVIDYWAHTPEPIKSWSFPSSNS